MAAGAKYGFLYQVELTPDEMELLHNALEAYVEELSRQVTEHSEQGDTILQLEGLVVTEGAILGGVASDTGIPVAGIFIGTRADASNLRADLVRIAGHDMTEEGV